MKNGLLYSILKFVIDNIKYLTMVEWFKYVGKIINPKKNDTDYKLTYSRLSVDIFIILKWVFVLLITKLAWTNGFLTFFIWYLLITNLYSYFYYHIWTDEALNTDNFEKHRTRRRFINLILAVGFSELCFSYLYRHPYVNEFNWNVNATYVKSIWYSISNSLAANYAVVSPNTDLGNSISMIQLIVTFIFVTIILGKSIPQTSLNN